MLSALAADRTQHWHGFHLACRSCGREGHSPIIMQPGVNASICCFTGICADGLLIHGVVGILPLPLYARFLAPAEHGVLELVDDTMSMFALVVGSRVAIAVIGLGLGFNGESMPGRLPFEARPSAFSVFNLVRLVANVRCHVAVLVFVLILKMCTQHAASAPCLFASSEAPPARDKSS